MSPLNLNTVLTGPLSNADNFFIVADRTLRNIYQVDATSGATGQLLPLSEWTLPKVLVYDSTAKLLYWADLPACTINRYNPLTHSSTVIYRDPSNNGMSCPSVVCLSLCHLSSVAP